MEDKAAFYRAWGKITKGQIKTKRKIIIKKSRKLIWKKASNFQSYSKDGVSNCLITKT